MAIKRQGKQRIHGAAARQKHGDHALKASTQRHETFDAMPQKLYRDALKPLSQNHEGAIAKRNANHLANSTFTPRIHAQAPRSHHVPNPTAPTSRQPDEPKPLP